MPEFTCTACNYKSARKYNMYMHLSGKKHKKHIIETAGNQYVDSLYENSIICVCGDIFHSQCELRSHYDNHKCIEDVSHSNPSSTPAPVDSDVLTKILEDNAKLHTILRDLIPMIGDNVVNNQFNLNVFLNEECKNALNMSEFVDQLQIEISDMEYTRKNSLESGIKSIIHKALIGMDVSERPIHCTDSKRRTMYIKENNVWEKDTKETNHRLVKDGVDAVIGKQVDHIKKWVIENPEYATAGQIQDEFVELARVCSETLTDAQTSRIIGDVATKTCISQNKLTYDDVKKP